MNKNEDLHPQAMDGRKHLVSAVVGLIMLVVATLPLRILARSVGGDDSFFLTVLDWIILFGGAAALVQLAYGSFLILTSPAAAEPDSQD
jgi:hypothetical protein